MSLDFPQIVPSRRSVEVGDYPVKKFKSQNGDELRILYGDKRTGKKLSLQYNGITDVEAELFYDHYEQQKGTFSIFYLSNSAGGGSRTKFGWEGNIDVFGAAESGNAWRYEKPPVITNVYPGVSNVTVSLLAVLR